MKKKLFIAAVLIMLGMTMGRAQIKLGSGIGYAQHIGEVADLSNGGITGHFEVGYGITDNIDVSLYLQGDLIDGKNSTIQNDDLVFFPNLALGTYMIQGRFFLKKEGLRPYASIGLGITNASFYTSSEPLDITAVKENSSNFSFRPAVGVKYKIFNFNIAYLNAGKNENKLIQTLSINGGVVFTFGGK